jgi:ankyrin repeat protein
VDAVKSLLARKADVRAKEAPQGHTALMQAVANKHVAVARALIEAGADVNAHANSGFTPLMFAAQQGDMEATRVLLAAGARVNDATTEGARWVGDTALLVASLNGHEELAIYLLDQGADPNAADDNGFTALHFAIFHGLTKMSGVRMRQYTGIFLARPNMVELVKALLAHGANPNARVKTVHGGDRWLRVSGKYPTAGSVSPVGETPFILAARSYDANLMRILVAGGADPMLTTEEGVSALMVAAGVSRYRGEGPPLMEEQETNALEAVKLATELGNDVNAADTAFGLTALHGAAFSGSDRIIQYLAEKGANLDAKDITGQTALHKALNITPPGVDVDNLVPKIVRKSTADLLIKLGATPVKLSQANAPPKSAGNGTE